MMILYGSLPNALRPLIAAVLRATGEERKAHSVLSAGWKDTHDLWGLNVRLGRYREKFLAAMREAGVQALLCPGGTLPAIPHGTSKPATLKH